jgi:hypothetical protein
LVLCLGNSEMLVEGLLKGLRVIKCVFVAEGDQDYEEEEKKADSTLLEGLC